MFKNNLEYFDLEKELRELALGLKRSCRPLRRISAHYLKSGIQK